MHVESILGSNSSLPLTAQQCCSRELHAGSLDDSIVMRHSANMQRQQTLESFSSDP